MCCTHSFVSCRSIKRSLPRGKSCAECQETECITKYFANGSRNVRSALNHLQFKDANGGNGGFRKEDKANRYRSTMAIPESRIQLAAEAQDALYACLKFSESRVYRMHAENSLSANNLFICERQMSEKECLIVCVSRFRFADIRQKTGDFSILRNKCALGLVENNQFILNVLAKCYFAREIYNEFREMRRFGREQRNSWCQLIGESAQNERRAIDALIVNKRGECVSEPV